MKFIHIFSNHKHLFTPIWGRMVLVGILLAIIVVNIKPGLLILGNDNFSPELDPGLTLERSIFSPAWRTYRVLGIPSDSEQADLFRTVLFYFASKIMPLWVVSQGYLFFTFFIASISSAFLTLHLTRKCIPDKYHEALFLFGGLFYTCSMLTSWIYFYPLHLFVAAYAFLPFVLWRLSAFLERPTIRSTILLIISSLFLATSALTATMFFICSLAIMIYAFVLFIAKVRNNWSQAFIQTIAALIIIFTFHLYWFLPFITYVQTNTKALQDSAINRDITATTLENEARHNTALNSIRFFASWMDTKENNATYTFEYRDWYKTSPIAGLLSILPIIFALIGMAWIVRNKSYRFIILFLTMFAGWYAIKGINPPLGDVFNWFQTTFPVLAQVFRWQSSKLWPFVALPLSLFASIGVIVIYGFIRSSFARRGLARYNTIAAGFMTTIIIALCVYVFPYFLGDLVRDKVYTKPPPEYQSLAHYLKQTDPHGRIYIAPEANSLYFRTYSWGFFGSVVLNYILPNPIVEKALVTGSDENEQAFSVLTNAYYSEQPDIFRKALETYDVTYVLSDKYAAAGDVGYRYNWSVHASQVEHNPYVAKLWEQGKLALFKVNDVPIEDAEKLSSVHDAAKLNSIRLLSESYRPYFTTQEEAGPLYPFALPFSKVSFSDKEIIAESLYTGVDSDYEYVLDPTVFTQAPTSLIYDRSSGQIYASPLYPTFDVNNHSIVYQKPSVVFSAPDAFSFLTLGNKVTDIHSSIFEQEFVSFPFERIIEPSMLRVWKAASNTYPLVNPLSPSSFLCSDQPIRAVRIAWKQKINCKGTPITFTSDTVSQINLTLTSTIPAKATVCVWSARTGNCINTDRTIVISTSLAPHSFTVPEIIKSGDAVTVFIDLESLYPQGSDIEIHAGTIVYSTESFPLTLSSINDIYDSQHITIPLHPGDTLGIHIPRLSGSSSWQFTPKSTTYPELSSSTFDEETTYEQKITTTSDGVELLNLESNTSMYANIPIDNLNEMGLLAISATNTSGIPLTFSIRDTQNDYPLWKRQIYPGMKINSIDLRILPRASRSYVFEAFTTALGPRPSINTVHNIVFQTIPPSWYTLKLTPTNTLTTPARSITELMPTTNKDTSTFQSHVDLENKEIVSIPNAVSPNWLLGQSKDAPTTSLFMTYIKTMIGGNNLAPRVTINGWKQGWMVNTSGTYSVVFTPTVLGYLGALPAVGILIWLLGTIVNRGKRHRNK